MSASHSTPSAAPGKPAKPYPDFPLTPHPTGRWCKKVKGKLCYFGRWDDPEGALREYEQFAAGKPVERAPRPANDSRPAKPYPQFPLTAHPAGYWCKKIRGTLHYFGKWDDPDGALVKYLEEKDALHAGRSRRADPEALTVKGLANAFLNTKQALLDAGELTQRTWDEYWETCELLVKTFGKGRLVADLGPDDFASLRKKMAKRWGPVRLANVVQRVRSVFKFAADNDLIDRQVRYGQGFARPRRIADAGGSDGRPDGERNATAVRHSGSSRRRREQVQENPGEAGHAQEESPARSGHPGWRRKGE